MLVHVIRVQKAFDGLKIEIKIRSGENEMKWNGNKRLHVPPHQSNILHTFEQKMKNHTKTRVFNL